MFAAFSSEDSLRSTPDVALGWRPVSNAQVERF
jgi:hypothetical protein